MPFLLLALRASRSRSSVPVLGCFLILTLGGCAYSNTTSQLGPASARLPQPGDMIYVAVASGAPVDQSAALEPGRVLSDLTLGILQEDFPSAKRLETERESEALQQSRNDGVPYLVIPTIIHWGNQGTLASRFADSVSVNLRLLFAPTNQLVKSIHYQGSNNSVTIGSTIPEALTDENFRVAVKSLLRSR